jgi:hypothetical protein
MMSLFTVSPTMGELYKSIWSRFLAMQQAPQCVPHLVLREEVLIH